MDVIYCTVVGCSSPANLFLSGDHPASERLCSYHWAYLNPEASEHVSRLVLTEASGERPEQVGGQCRCSRNLNPV